jgi:hypothetical protein
MTDTTCPSCDAPAPAGASRCARCGYEFYEDGGAALPRPRPSRRGWVAILAAAALVAIAVAGVAAIGGGDDEPAAAGGDAQDAHLEVLSRHPLTTPAAERLLTGRYLAIPDDDESDVHCARRVPRPAHSVRRCDILYPGGTIRTIVVITTANGSEVLSEP